MGEQLVICDSGATHRITTLLLLGNQKANSLFGSVDCLSCVAVVGGRGFALNEGWFESVNGNPRSGTVALNLERFLSTFQNCMWALVPWLERLLDCIDLEEHITDLNEVRRLERIMSCYGDSNQEYVVIVT
jgi:hypothetical protein